MADIVISEFMDDEAVREGLKGYDVLYDPKLVDRPDDLLRAIADARALIVRNRTQVRDRVLTAGKNLKVIGRLGVGLDNIDVEGCKAHGIAVFPATGANDLSVAEYVICTAMMLLRSAYRATDAMVAGQWPRNALMGREISGKTLGLIGFGAIAKETARRAAALGMEIMAYDPYANASSFSEVQVKQADVDKVLWGADVISLHVPLTENTRMMIDAARISTMKQGAILINAARGGVVDEAAVAAALKSGHLGGAALDVFEDEPLVANKAAIFRDVPNLILTPHIAGVTHESNVRVSWLTVENVKRALSA
ncbi:MAG: hydroxyacid dehydrogenase [Beijerinckiaceae bacterium]